MLSIFLVDDEPIILRGLKKLIPWEENGFQISGEASSGEEALRKITAQNTDIVITDLKMPKMDGVALCERLKQSIPGIRCIVLTAYDDFHYLQQSIRNGVADYLLKPVKANILLESLKKMQWEIEQNRYPYPYDLEIRILKATLQQTEPLDEALAILLHYTKTNKIPLPVFQRMCQSILRQINELLDESGKSLSDLIPEQIIKSSFINSSGDECLHSLKSILKLVQEHRSKNQDCNIMEQIKRYIEKNLGQDISLNIVAKRFFLNASYLSQLFKKNTGTNYSVYVNQLRMEKAKHLLEDDNLLISDISDLVGYGDWRYFSQNFKKHTGMTPSEYRAKQRNKE